MCPESVGCSVSARAHRFTSPWRSDRLPRFCVHPVYFVVPKGGFTMVAHGHCTARSYSSGVQMHYYLANIEGTIVFAESAGYTGYICKHDSRKAQAKRDLLVAETAGTLGVPLSTCTRWACTGSCRVGERAPRMQRRMPGRRVPCAAAAAGAAARGGGLAGVLEGVDGLRPGRSAMRGGGQAHWAGNAYRVHGGWCEDITGSCRWIG